ncbi:carbon storage regulator CsrA [Hydrogenimonas cancrithermarum]|uniref:Translational regulator CsrA n=1 Tax=Hydrogenimonas cancrithermarum TaxID=2993563 RepID=A0ABM8FP00_9BACT|nr:carbon storage regulator CsrA [Hydrogenimonas cancrithermarum]BDY13370.1 carbon storage regulator [Hydrogenimonas cancrithermarum]
MLVLTRKKDEAIRIGDNIVIKIIATDKNSVRIGIEAPDNVTILREELVRAVSEENLKATQKAPVELLAKLREKLSKS